MAWGGMGGGMSESVEEAVAREGRGRSSDIKETVLGGLATAMGVEDEEEEDEDEEEEEDGVGLLPDSVEEPVRNLGGSNACLGGRGSCWGSCDGRGSGAKRTPADSTEGRGMHIQTDKKTNKQTKGSMCWRKS